MEDLKTVLLEIESDLERIRVANETRKKTKAPSSRSGATKDALYDEFVRKELSSKQSELSTKANTNFTITQTKLELKRLWGLMTAEQKNAYKNDGGSTPANKTQTTKTLPTTEKNEINIAF